MDGAKLSIVSKNTICKVGTKSDGLLLFSTPIDTLGMASCDEAICGNNNNIPMAIKTPINIFLDIIIWHIFLIFKYLSKLLPE